MHQGSGRGNAAQIAMQIWHIQRRCGGPPYGYKHGSWSGVAENLLIRWLEAPPFTKQRAQPSIDNVKLVKVSSPLSLEDAAFESTVKGTEVYESNGEAPTWCARKFDSIDKE